MRFIDQRCLVMIAAGLLVAACSGGDDGASNSTGGSGGTAAGGKGGNASGGTGGNASGGTGGNASGGTAGTTGTASCTAAAAEISRVQGWLTDTQSGLPDYAYTNIQKFFDTADKLGGLACAIAASCEAFAPSESGWLEYCEAVLTSAIVAESSYDPTESVLDSYGQRDVNGTTANDPTVGLLQIRFSSTVNDYNYYGPLGKMPAIGCDWPAELPSHANDDTFWATAGGTTYTSWMQTPSCNIALAAWYYFENATGNGGQDPIYAYQYCQGQGIAGDMVIGLLSHLEGPGFPRPPDASNPYVTGIKSRFVSLLGGTLPSPDPFTQQLSPETTKYCK
jgi:hypothetical protein